MIIKYPKLLNNNWLKQGCFIGSCEKPYDVYVVTSIVDQNGVKIKYKPYCGILSLNDIYFIPDNFVFFENNKPFLKKEFDLYFEQNKNDLYLKYEYGIAECNNCKKTNDHLIDYCGNGSFFCDECKSSTKKLSFSIIEEIANKKHSINYSSYILSLINVFTEICFQKMNDISKVEKFIGTIGCILLNSNCGYDIKQFKNTILINDISPDNICKLKDNILCELSKCFLALHDGTKKDNYIYIITKKMPIILQNFILLKNKSL